MDLAFIKDMYIPIVLVICLCVGYVFKRWLPNDNKWIPTVMLILGAVLGCIAVGHINLEAIGAGAFTGLASTGLHQLFTQLINGGRIDEEEEDDDDVEEEGPIEEKDE